MEDMIKEEKYVSLQVSSIVSHLVRRGYLAEKALYKRQLVITEAGKRNNSEIFIILIKMYEFTTNISYT